MQDEELLCYGRCERQVSNTSSRHTFKKAFFSSCHSISSVLCWCFVLLLHSYARMHVTENDFGTPRADDIVVVSKYVVYPIRGVGE